MSKIDFVMRDRAGYLPWTCQDWFTNYDDRGCCWYMGNKILWIILKLKNELSIVNLKWRSIILTSIVLNECIKNFRTGTIPFGISFSAFWKTNNFILKKNHVFFSLKKKQNKNFSLWNQYQSQMYFTAVVSNKTRLTTLLGGSIF